MSTVFEKKMFKDSEINDKANKFIFTLRLGLLVLQKKNNKCFFYPAICSASRGGLEAFLHFTDG